MGKLTIIGNEKPVIGKREMYSVSLVNDLLHPLNPFKNPLQVSKIHWEVMVQTKTGWRKGGSDKEGQTVPFTFGQKSLFHKGIKIIARQGEDYGELIVHPQRAKESKITRVELLDVNYKPIPKGKKLSYRDTIIARAYCVEMFDMNIAFTLWEDDAQGEGHNPMINALNKINPVPVLGRVNEKGMAEAVFRLPFYTMAVLIANARTASGNKSEGPTHEYYVTADVVSKHIQKASPNIDVANPTYNPEPPRKREVPNKQTPSTPKPKTTPAPEKTKPKPDSSKFPVTTGGKKSDDPQGKILSAEFVDNNGNRLHSSKVGTTVRIKIVAKDMENKKVKVKIWEEDNIKWTHDMIFEKDCVLIGDNNYLNNVQLTKRMFDKANDGGSDSSKQDYFIEVIHNDTSVTSSVIPITLDAKPTEMESGNSATMVKEPKLEKKKEEKVCECEAKVRAFMRMIRIGEATSDENGYSRIVGGSTFKDHGKDFSDHPKIMIWISSINDYSSASGAYQITKKNWNDQGFVKWRKDNNLTDFSPETQDKYCVYLIKEKKKALDLIKDNDIKGAISKCRTEWASLPGAGYGQREEKLDTILKKYDEYYHEELKGPTKKLHIKKGFLKDFGENCCSDTPSVTNNINRYRIDIDKFSYPKIMENKKSKKYQYDIYENGQLLNSITLEKNEYSLLPFPESGANWGRFGTRDKGGDNWVNEKVCAALLGFFYSLPKNGYTNKLYFNDISANNGRNIGHKGHNIAGNDVDLRYPGSGNGGKTVWQEAMKAYGTEERFIIVLENILFVGVRWGFNKNYAYKENIKHTTGLATSVHKDHFHLGLR